MSENSTPPKFPYGYYPSYSNAQEHDPLFAWSFSGSQTPLQLPYGSQVNPQTGRRLSEDPAGASIAAVESNHAAKVPIPRTTNPNSTVVSGRVSRACEPCREQKAKCSGHQPVCQRCQESGIRCSYGDRKREKLARQLSDLTKKTQTYEESLRDIFPMLDPQLARRIEHILNTQASPNNEPSGSDQISSTPAASNIANASYISDNTSTSSGIKDFIDEDFNSDGKLKAMGFIGEHSEIAWLHRLKGELEEHATENSDSEHPSVASANYFLNDSEFHVMDDINPSDVPAQPIAKRLVEIYFQNVHPCFPVMSKLFVRQFNNFYSDSTSRPGKKWLAIMNLVFAIAARYSSLVQDHPDEQLNHELYFSRAWKLNASDTALIDPPDLQQVQVESLAAFYLLSVGRINRAWRICGISIGSALAMGLHLRNEKIDMAPILKEIRYRVWWALCVLDTLLCMISGRPLRMGDDFHTTPLPLPFREEDLLDKNVAPLISDHDKRNAFMSSVFSRSRLDETESPSKRSESEKSPAGTPETITPNISLYFLHIVDLKMIARQAVRALYAPESARKSWTGVEMAVSFLNRKADIWVSDLPAVFQFRQESQNSDGRQRTSLAFRFYSTKILILHPCLTRLGQQGSAIEIPGSYCNTMASLCVDSACEMLNLLPDQPDSVWLLHFSPWAYVLHYLMQSLTVLLIYLFIKEKPKTDKSAMVIESVNKALHWLHDMSRKDESSRQAWWLCKELLSHYESTVDMDVDA